MLSAESLASYSSTFESDSLDTLGEPGIQQRLGLYQVFLRLYEHNPGLLNEILNLESPANKALTGASLPYMQGTVLGEQVYLVTNLLKSRSQALYQPQHIWTIGRDSRKVLLPVYDRRLSRCHAAIRYTEGAFQLVDLNSSNGSFVNGESVRHTVTLKDGDRIRLGSVTFCFFVCQHTQPLAALSASLLSQINESPSTSLDHRSSQGCRSMEANTPTNLYDDTMLFLQLGKAQSKRP